MARRGTGSGMQHRGNRCTTGTYSPAEKRFVVNNSWHATWDHAVAIATGSPQVIAHRVGMMHPVSWSPVAAAECQQMVAEKVEAAAESWLALCAAWLAVPSAASAPLWWDSGFPQGIVDHAVGAVNQALDPVSRCVSANVDRLRKD